MLVLILTLENIPVLILFYSNIGERTNVGTYSNIGERTNVGIILTLENVPMLVLF